ncbi:hypothetical protein ElyMa_005141400 [Elysia marginata]|uniref:Transmembrane protein n=1 Tax=Elysia marginata TaxID=1093978 RepID=A0AAV4JNV2_9GAST|nr:hypothetical protein ElyMa_005141400 [Elysia marginata]
MEAACREGNDNDGKRLRSAASSSVSLPAYTVIISVATTFIIGVVTTFIIVVATCVIAIVSSLIEDNHCDC